MALNSQVMLGAGFPCGTQVKRATDPAWTVWSLGPFTKEAGSVGEEGRGEEERKIGREEKMGEVKRRGDKRRRRGDGRGVEND